MPQTSRTLSKSVPNEKSQGCKRPPHTPSSQHQRAYKQTNSAHLAIMILMNKLCKLLAFLQVKLTQLQTDHTPISSKAHLARQLTTLFHSLGICTKEMETKLEARLRICLANTANLH